MTKKPRRGRQSLLVVTLVVIALVPFCCGTAFAQALQPSADSDSRPVHEMDKVTPIEFHGDVRHLSLVGTPQRQSSFPRRLTPHPTSKSGVPASAAAAAAAAAAPDVPVVFPPRTPMPSPTRNFAGLSFSDTCGGVPCGAGWPPDANGDVGLNHYIQAVNDAYAIYSKTGTLLAAFTENQLWSGGGTTPCNGNSSGDPVVLYDPLADRWILTHVGYAVSGGTPLSPFYQCIAVSKTGDPVAGGWWLYPLRMDLGGSNFPPVGTLIDYPRFGIWPDCLYLAANGFQFPTGNFIGTSFASFSRSDLYSGAALTWGLGFINNATDPYSMIPSNLLGRSVATLPSPGTPNYFVSQSTTASVFEVRTFTAGPNCGGGGVLSAATSVSRAIYTVPGETVVPQPGTSVMLDSLSDVLMQKVQYRRVGAAESLWVVHSVQTSPTSTVRPQWAQLDVTGGVIGTTPVQQQIYAPDTTLYRWMGSLAVDRQGNMALGYSTSSGSVPNFPSIAYSGRLTIDPSNTLPQSEVQLVAGASSQTNTCGGSACPRWGDYSSMSVDPVDDCTFWYTNQYYSSAANGASGNWQTRIGSFKFPSCTSSGAPDLTIVKTHSGSFGRGQVGATYTLTVSNAGTTPTNGSMVTVTDTLPTGLTATALGGAGWSCTLATLTCTRSDVVADGSSYPAITLTVTVAANAPNSVINTATVAGGGDTNAADNTANDVTAVLTVTFTDVPSTDPFFTWIEALFGAGITGGCSTSPPQYCPGGGVTRGQMAVFLLRGIHGAGYSPPVATGTIFTDVPGSHSFASWIEQLAREGITGGCSTSPPRYCPDAVVTRGQMAVFLLRAKHGAGFQPPPATGMFADVLVGDVFAPWIEQLAREGVTGGCATSPARYCPDNPVTRGQMAVFLVRTFQLPLTQQFVVSVTFNGGGSGTVTSAPPGIACNTNCSHAFDVGTLVALTATPTNGSTFVGWSGGGCGGTGMCTVAVAATVTATFTAGPAGLSSLPLQPLTLSAPGIVPGGSAVTVGFSNGAGFSHTDQPIRVNNDGTVTVAVPLYVDPVSSAIGPGTVSVTLTQGGVTTPPVQLTIQDLPALSTYGFPLGEISHAFKEFAARLIGRKLGQLQAAQALLGPTMDTSATRSTLQSLLVPMILARNDVDRVRANPATVIANGTLDSGAPLRFDASSVDLMDRIYAVALLGVFSSSLPGGSQADQSGDEASPRSKSDDLHFLVDLLKGQNAGEGLVLGAQESVEAESPWQKGLAIVKGVAPVIALFVAPEAGLVLAGAVAAIDVGTTLVTLGVDAYALYEDSKLGGNSAAYQHDLDVLKQDGIKGAVSTFDDVLSTSGGIAELAGKTTIQAGIEALSLISTSAQIGRDAALEVERITNLDVGDQIGQTFPLPSQTSGFGLVTGTVNITTDAGTNAVPMSPGLCCFGTSSMGILSIADQSGNYDMWVPLGVPNTDYGNLTLSISDLISGTILNSTTVDLRGLNTSQTMQLPTLSASCSDFDALDPDSDDPDCD